MPLTSDFVENVRVMPSGLFGGRSVLGWVFLAFPLLFFVLFFLLYVVWVSLFVCLFCFVKSINQLKNVFKLLYILFIISATGYEWTLANTRDVLPYICEISQSEAYRIVRTARDYGKK